MPRPMPLACGLLSGAPASANSRSTSGWSVWGRPSPPRPSGKDTQASPASYRARRNSSRSVVAGSWAARKSATRRRRSVRVRRHGHRASRAAAWRRSSSRRQGVLVHLVRAVGEPQRADAGVRAGQREVLRQPAGAVHLDRLVEDPLDGRRGGDLDRLDLGVRALVADGVHQPGGLEDQQPQLLEPHPGLGDPVADHALLGERLAERDALARRARTSARWPARRRRSSACSGGCGPGRAAPARWRTRRPRRRSGWPRGPGRR